MDECEYCDIKLFCLWEDNDSAHCQKDGGDMKYKFFCDFDGTITKEDVIDRILEEFADPLWVDIEQSWVNGEIGSRECLAMQTKLIRAKVRDLLDFLESIHIDETFADFVRDCRNKGFEIVILSDGIDLFIKSILDRHGVNDIRVYSNSLGSTNGRYEMYFPYFRKDCLSRSGICKCKIMEELSSPSSLNILVGDGRSDFCIARKADLTFAKSALLDFCRVEKIPHIEHREFGDIVVWLRNQIGKEDLDLKKLSSFWV
jgi:2-hydroxy-3-keto-5-methylthiopentenyl-1-phosphate phosphatase